MAMGIDLANIHGQDRLVIVTAERPIYDVCQKNKGKGFPAAINLHENDFPRSMFR